MYLNIKLCILQSGFRQNRLAQAIQMDEGLLSRIINGFREPTPTQRRRIAEFLQQNEEWLFTPNHGMKHRWSNGGGSEHNSI